MRKRQARLAKVLVLAGVLGALGVVGSRAAAEDPAANPFHDLATALHMGRPVHVHGAVVVPVRLAKDREAGFAAHVGLRGASVTVLPLPLPAGEMHVRISNRGDLALEIPPGETLLSPVGPSRSVDRTVWIPAGAAAFVPVIHADTLPPPGPYVFRGFGLTPIEQQRVRAGTWDERMQARNRRFAVEEKRVSDASAAYATDAFAGAVEPYAKALRGLTEADDLAGVLVADARGIFFARVESDAARFAQAWPGLLAGIAIDGVMDGGAQPSEAMQDVHLRREARRLLDALAAGPVLSRATFGLGTERRIALADGTGAWEGLAIDGRPVAVTLLRSPTPTEPTPPQPPPPENPTPVPGVVERDPRPSEYEKRVEERRNGAPGAGATPSAPAPPSPAPAVPGPQAPASPGPSAPSAPPGPSGAGPSPGGTPR